ncbi:MAG TPA: MJ0042-type zinc finger domain-containing protein [Tepidisphaeraceae bacterium]|nr:MJ0042-type zinc finger domain-containing protein [Tepidisphaeraceae bacterium]
MPIDAQCASCSTRYRIVSTAAGRRVKCRKCGNPFYVPGEPVAPPPLVNLSALAELEKTATPAQTQQGALIQYKAAVSVLAEPPPGAPGRRTGGKGPRTRSVHGTSIHDLLPDGKLPTAAAAKGPSGLNSFAGSVALLGALIAAGLLVGSYYMATVAVITFWVGFLGAIALLLAGGIWGLVIVFMKDSTQGLLCLIPFYRMYYVMTHREMMKHPRNLQLAGLVMMGVAFGAMYAAGLGPAANEIHEKAKQFHTPIAMADEPPPPETAPRHDRPAAASPRRRPDPRSPAR